MIWKPRKWILAILVMVGASVITEVSNNTYTILYRAAAFDYSGITTGTIVSSDEYEKNTYKALTRPALSIKYVYEVGGKTYYSTYVGHHFETYQVQKRSVMYQPGNEIEVYYDKSRPEYSVLDRSFPQLYVIGQLLVIAIVGVIFFFF